MAEARIVIREGAQAGREVSVQGELTVGRAESSGLVIADEGISRSHALISAGAGAVAIEDLRSSNGTFVNGERLEGRRTLRDGDEIQLGGVVLELVGGPRETIPPPSAAPPRRREPIRRPQPVASAPRDAVDDYNLSALAAIVLGPLSIALLAFSSGSSFYAALPIAVTAVALGAIGRNKVDRGESARYRSLASAGRTLGIVGAVLAAVVLVALMVITQALDVSAESLPELIDEIGQEIESR